MTTTHVLIVGGSSGIGLALAERLLADGASVTIAGRSAQRLGEAANHLERIRRPGSGQLRTGQVDIGREEEVRALLAGIGGTGALDHVVVTAADAAGAYAPLPDFDLAAAQAVLGTKLLGPWLVAKHAAGQLPPTGSITFTSGIAAYRPAAGSSMIASANGALEALARALAVELAPIRVNVVSPGWVDTPIWDTLAGDGKTDRLAAMAARLPVRRIGTPADLAGAYAALLDNGFVTGTVVHVDGGHRLV
jgi:NAD(P)-dependent dehydrogenase (short-subunit alcohol dehydrogenase family)